MWIFCGGMQRSASTLQYQIASELVERNNLGVRITWHNPEKHSKLLPINSEKHYKVFKSHILTDSIKGQFVSNNAVGLYIYRDLRDVVSSLQEKNKTIYKDHALVKLINNLIKQYELWSSLKIIHISRYEDVAYNICKEILSIARFIGIVNNCVDTDELAQKLSLYGQKRFIDGMRSKRNLVCVNNYNIYDPDTLLHLNHITSGKIGRYKNDLTSEQIKIIEENAYHWMVANGYAFSA